MNHAKALQRVKQEARISDVFPITHLNSPTIFESNSSILGSVIHLDGVAFDIEEPQTLNHYGFLLHQALLGLDERFIVYVTLHRKKANCTLDGDFNGLFAQTLNDRYQARFTHQNLYINQLYLTVVLKGDTSTKTSSVLNWAQKVMGQGRSELASHYRATQMTMLTRAVKQLCSNLTPFGAAVLGEQDQVLGYSELMQFLSLAVNAGLPLNYPMPVYSPPIAHDIPATFKAEQLYPNGHIGQYLSSYQLLFGEYIQFQGTTKQAVRFGSMLSLKKYPTMTASILLDTLLSLDSELISTHTFAPLARDASLKTIIQKRSKLISSEDKAFSQIDALTDLEDSVASDSARLGLHHHTVMLLADSTAELECSILETTKRYASNGVVVINESLGIEPAFWSQIPCNHHLIARATLITSLNFVDFCPLHNTPAGFLNQNFLGSAVTLLETPSNTPVFFNYHSKV